MSSIELTNTIRALRELNVIIETAQAEAEAIKDIIKAEMTAMETDELRAGEYKVTWKPVTSSRFDSTAFKRTHAELYNQYCKESTTRRFCVA